MSLFRRRRLPPDLVPVYAAFEVTLGHVEAAKALLVASVPKARFPGVPLAEALSGFRDDLVLGLATMGDWRVPAIESAWARCDHGIRVALASADAHLLEEADERSFDEHLEFVQELLDPLEPFEGAEDRFRELRT